MKTLYTIYTSFAKRLAVVLTFLMTIGAVFADTYTWTLASGDLGSTGSPLSSVKKNNVTWTTGYTWGTSEATKYFGWDTSDSKRGVQIGAGSSANKCTKAVFSTSDISGTITNVTVNGSHASSGGASIVIKVGGETVKSSTNFTTTAADYSTGTISKIGQIEITISNSKAKAFYLKSIKVTYTPTPSGYAVTYNNGGRGTAPSNTTASSVTLSAITATGYTNTGWKANVDVKNGSTTIIAGNLIANGTTVTLSQATTFTAQWTAKTSTISFDQNGGEGGQTATVTATYDQPMPTPITLPTRYGHTFGGYYDGTGGTGTQYYKADGTSARTWNKTSASATLYAKWTEKELTNYRTTCSTQPSYSVTSNLSHVTAAAENATTINPEDEELWLSYSAESGWNLPTTISVKMGGVEISDFVWDNTNGYLFLMPSSMEITGDIAITINGWQQLATPTGLNSEYTSTSATLTWNSVPNASSYLVTIVDGEDLSAYVPNTKTSHTFEGLNPSTVYLWTVKAIGDGTTYTNSEESETAEFTTLPAGYTITYNTNGGDAIPAASGTALPNPLPTPTKEHYEFQGWFTDEDCTQAATAGAPINADIPLYAKWEAVTYTITLVPNYPNSLTGVFKDKEGNVIADNLVIPIKYGTESQPLTNFYSTLSLDGYQFDAFYTQTEGGQRRVNTGTLTKDLTLYARWKQEYTITWNVLGAETGTTTIVEGLEWTLPEVNASCNDKQFVGWTTTPILEEQDEAPATLYTETNQFPLETNTYYAVFANVEVTGTGEYVKLTEDLLDYSGEYLIVYEAGSRAFNGGLGESSLDDNDNYISITISDNVVQATDEVEEARFIVAKVDGGYSIQSASGLYIGRSTNSNGMDIEQTYNEDFVNTFPNCSTIRGKGEADIQYNNTTYPSQQNRFRYYASSLNTIALYKKTGTNMTNYTTSCVPTYTITWQNYDGTVLETNKVAENTMPEYNGSTPTKEADAQYTYTFDGWTPDIVAATEDAIYTATYTETLRTYTITWKNYDGTILKTDENVEYGETPTYNGETPTKAATAQYTYTFKGWDPTIAEVTGNATYTATFTPTVNTYTVTFEMNGHGTAPDAQTVEYGSNATKPADPTADGYEFAGWYIDEQCTTPWNFETDVVTGTTPLYAKWLEIFTITWKANGLEYTTTEVTEGEQITPPSSPDLGDYCGQVFAGWTDAEMAETTNDAPTLYPNPTPFPTASEESPTTFYAVFADYEN